MASDNKSSGGDQAGFGSWSTGLRFRGQHQATKLLHKKFANTSRFVVSSKVWMNTIPTRDCDILMTFPAKTEDQTLMWLLARLRARTPELAVHVRHHSNTGVYGFYMTATYENLLKGAEELCIHKPLKGEFGGGTKEFVYGEADCFENVEDSTAFFTTQERQSIVKNMLFNLRAVDGDRIGKLTFLEGQALVPFLISRGIVKQVLPLHNTEDLDYLRNNWVAAFTKPQPLGRICDYFGVKIALYFAYLGHYTKALVIPAFLGLVFWLALDRDQWWDDWIFVVYALVNVIWSTLYLEHWKRESAEHAYKWGTLDKEDELLTEPRPLYTGYLVKSKVTGRQEPCYPTWKRNMIRYLISLPIICACLSVVFVTMLYIFSVQDWINARIKQGEMPFYFKFLPKIMLALSIGILDDIYKKIAYWLTNLENYRLDETYELNLILKLVLFQFVNSFLSLFYIAFYLQDMDRLKEQLAALLITRQVIGNIKEALVPWCFEKLKLYRIGYQMTSTMSPDTLERHMQEMTGFSKQGLESALREHEGYQNESSETTEPTQSANPTDTNNANVNGSGKEPTTGAATEGDGEAGDETGVSLADLKVKDEIDHSGPQLTQAEVEAAMKTYEDTFDDYLEMFIQFGYVTLFSSAFPMAAMSALLNNVIEIRSDAFKLCTAFQRPFGQRVASIGIWQDALEMLALIAVMVNCALIGMSGLADRLFPDLSTTHRIVAIILLEHLILALKLGLACAIPDVPQWVAEEKARLDFLRREALKEKKKVKDLWSKAFESTKKKAANAVKFKFNKDILKDEQKKQQEESDKKRLLLEAELKGKEEAEVTIQAMITKKTEQEKKTELARGDSASQLMAGAEQIKQQLSYAIQPENLNRFVNFLKVSLPASLGRGSTPEPGEENKSSYDSPQYSASADDGGGATPNVYPSTSYVTVKDETEPPHVHIASIPEGQEGGQGEKADQEIYVPAKEDQDKTEVSTANIEILQSSAEHTPDSQSMADETQPPMDTTVSKADVQKEDTNINKDPPIIKEENICPTADSSQLELSDNKQFMQIQELSKPMETIDETADKAMEKDQQTLPEQTFTKPEEKGHESPPEIALSKAEEKSPDAASEEIALAKAEAKKIEPPDITSARPDEVCMENPAKAEAKHHETPDITSAKPDESCMETNIPTSNIQESGESQVQAINEQDANGTDTAL